jgi:hypothetical protein
MLGSRQAEWGIQQMKKLIAPVLFTCVCVGVVLAGSPQPSKDPIVINTVKQLEQDLGDAMVRADIDKLNQIYADEIKSRRLLAIASTGSLQPPRVTQRGLLEVP